MADITITVDSTQVVRSRSELDRLGLTVVKQAQTVQRLERQYKTLDAAFNRGKLSAEQYAKGVQQIDTAIEMASSGNMQLAQSMNRVETAAEAAGAAMQRAHKPTNQFGMYAQQVGYQVGDFFVQVQSGTNALTAFGQQATQLAGLLPGLAGAIVGIGISLGTALGMAALRAQGLTIDFKQIGEDILKALEPIKPVVDAIGNAMSVAGSAIGTAFSFLIDNLDRVVAYAAAAAAMFGGQFVAGMVAAAVATASLSGALTLLRAALVRTGIGILVVAAGELAYQFVNLVEATGSIASAMTLLGDITSQVWNRVPLTVQSAWARIEASWARFRATIYDGLQDTTSAVVGWGNKVVGVFQGAFDATKVIWGALPSAIGNFAIQAANSLISSVESMLNAVVERINNFISSLSGVLAKIPGMEGTNLGTLEEVSLGGIENKYAGAGVAAGKAAADAFSAAMDKTYVETPTLFQGMSEQALTMAEGYTEASIKLAEAAQAPIEAWQRFRDVVFGGGEDESNGVDTSSWIKPDEGSGSSSGVGNAAVGRLAELREQIQLENELLGVNEAMARVIKAVGEDRKKYSDAELQAVAAEIQAYEMKKQALEEQQRLGEFMKSSMEEAFMSIIDGTASATDAFKKFAYDVIRELYRVLVVQQMVGQFQIGGGGILGSLAGPIGFRESGGSVMPGQPYIVGERGPEMIVPRHSGTVLNSKLTSKAMSGGGEVTVVNNIQVPAGADSANIRAEVAKMIPRITQITKAAVIDAKQRGGQMGAAFR